jgi:hypothetical protein
MSQFRKKSNFDFVYIPGLVSVQQQLRILERMSRTYPFLKIVGTGTSFQYGDTST